MKYIYKNKNIVSPEGTNNDRPLDAFLNRFTYEQYFPTEDRRRPKTGVIREGMKNLYGKVDTLGYVVLPKQEKIVQMTTGDEEKTLYCLEITNKLFSEMVSYYEKLKVRGKVTTQKTSFESIVPKKGLSFPKLNYRKYQERVLNTFVDSIANEEVSYEPIGDYRSFQKNYMLYISSIIEEKLPFTFSEFCLSHLSTPHQTGLVIDLSEEDCSDDQAKFKGFLTDVNFELVKSVANRFGFRIDHHVPWRLYLDLNSPYVIQELRNREIETLDEFFRYYYDRICLDEIPNLLTTAVSAYNSLVSQKGTFNEVVQCSGGRAKNVIKTRKPIDEADIRESYGKNHDIRMYAFLRSIELKKRWTQNQFDKLVTEAGNIREYRDEKRAYEFLESRFTDRTSELFLKKPLTKDKVFDNILEKDSRTIHYKF